MVNNGCSFEDGETKEQEFVLTPWQVWSHLNENSIFLLRKAKWSSVYTWPPKRGSDIWSRRNRNPFGLSAQRISATNLSSGGRPCCLKTKVHFRSAMHIYAKNLKHITLFMVWYILARWTSDGLLQSHEGGCLASTGGQVLFGRTKGSQDLQIWMIFGVFVFQTRGW